jgi:hypothetical protein
MEGGGVGNIILDSASDGSSRASNEDDEDDEVFIAKKPN